MFVFITPYILVNKSKSPCNTRIHHDSIVTKCVQLSRPKLDQIPTRGYILRGALPKQVFNKPVREIPVMISFDQEPINRLYKKSIDSHINQRLLSNFLAYFLNLTCFIRPNTLCQEGNSISSATPVLKTKFLRQLPHRRERKLQFSSTGLIRKIKRSLKALIG